MYYINIQLNNIGWCYIDISTIIITYTSLYLVCMYVYMYVYMCVCVCVCVCVCDEGLDKYITIIYISGSMTSSMTMN